ncbi:MAG: citrate lyase holo-[acyl-carrier protein] synthase [Sphaerochaeta sp.]|jgi:holo-ACP synthase CitX|uniref:citrate lyase holo-[acyl-carrier protein] synthase n=1 Tax=Sphaerochaeta sp. TaxID=1972642 RepID=UPI003D13D9E1
MADVSLAELLAGRDARTQMVEAYFTSGLPALVVATMNIAGPHKSSNLICRAFDLALQDLFVTLGSGQLLLLHKEAPASGPFAIFFIRQTTTAERMKELLVDFETNHPIGRWLDLDVKLRNGTSLGRKEIGHASRRCFLCNEEATVCRRNATHTIEELEAFTQDHLSTYVSNSGFYRPINL